MRQRVLADYESHYAPFLAMLAGWKQAVQAHYALGQEAALARLEEQFFPLGDWRFPPQTLAAPQRPPERTTEIPFETPFLDPTGQPWMTCGTGWMQPTVLANVSLRERDGVIVLDVERVGGAPADTLLTRGQLAFVAAPDEVVSALARGRWWVQTAGGDPQPAVCARYDGYLLFEREMQAARVNQRQLDLWLPPCHPYSRKIVCLRLATEEEAQAAAGGERPEMDAPDPARAVPSFRFTGVLPKMEPDAAEFLQPETASSLFYLNAVPVLQTAMTDHLFYAPFPRVGDEYALRITGLPNLFAAVAYNDGVSVPASMRSVPSNDPRAREDDVEIRFAQTVWAKMARVKLYHGSQGQGRSDTGGAGDEARPTLLERAPSRFTIPFPVLGGASVGGPEKRAEWVRTAWYHGVLRPALLTEGDLAEILRQRSVEGPGSLLRFRSAAREIIHQIEAEGAHWRSYLWPTLLAREERFGEGPPDDAFSGSEDYLPLVQRLRVTFERAPESEGVPEFLLKDVSNYLASVLSQYFIVSCFRVEGKLAS